jgi:NAD(P)-dependent dehydrogenase (short-subunit alcohol dehydrogenase family)
MDKEKYRSRVEGHALVLGGSGGIGKEIVRALVANGARAISFTYGRNAKSAQELADELKALGVKVHHAAMSIPTSDKDIPELKQFLDSAVGAVGEEITVMVNAIGISPNVSLSAQTIDDPETGWKRVFEVNTIGSFFAARTVAERMREKNIAGAIVLISSDNATLSWSPISAHYDASKSALQLNVQHLAKEFAPTRVLAVAPGWIDTPMNDTLPEDERKDVLSRIWLKRFGKPEEIAGVVAYFAGTGGSFANGVTMIVNGGYR